MVDLQYRYDDARDEVYGATSGRKRLTFVIMTDRGVSLGQSITLTDLSSDSSVMDLSSMISLKAVSSIVSLKVPGAVGVGERISML